MSWDINRVNVIGRLTRAPELKYTPSGAPVVNFGIAVGGKPSQSGEENVSFFNIVGWGKLAENISNYLSKGKQVAIDGRLDQRRWKAQDGSNRSVVEIIAERVEFLGAASEGAKTGGGYSGNGGGGYTKPETEAKPQANNKDSKGWGNSKNKQQSKDEFYDNGDWNPTPLDSNDSDNDVPF